MEIKMKEKVNTGSFTFKKRVIEETVELLGRKMNYVENDIYFVTMISFLNNMVENNLIIEALYDEKSLEDKMYEIVEPMYEKYILGDDKVLADFNDVAKQVVDYMKREVELRHHLTGFAYDLIQDLGGLQVDELKQMLTSLLNIIGAKDKKAAPRKTDEELKTEVKQDIEDLKMKALIEKFQRESQEGSTK